MMTAPENRKYTKTHEWVLLEGDVATVGLTDHAQQELGDITYLELPEAGDAISAGEPFGVVESVKAASDVYSPIDGEVIERNDAAVDTPEVINQSPYEGAWLVKVKIKDPGQVEALLDAKAYDAFADEQAV
ncbi:MAG TPA: glycine cleavage system protein GcvH [Thermomicrobiales bacterium]|jgi:glycine cleavage system H protein|nr:glycine cleavage system protein GcvH [Thermomicrobiales bacterium]